MSHLPLLFVGVPGGPELMIVLLIVVLLFGADKMPKLARASGQALGEFKRGRDDVEAELRNRARADAGATTSSSSPSSSPSIAETTGQPVDAAVETR